MSYGSVNKYVHYIGYLLETWQGGTLFYHEEQLDAIKAAFFKFQRMKDTKAALRPSLLYSSGQVCSVVATSLLVQIDTIDSS